MSAILKSEICATSEAYRRGRIWGAYFKDQGIDYGRPHDRYPSNPYPGGSQEAKDYDAGYAEGFAE